MIKEIPELNFPSYATLHKATVTLNDMGEKTISTEVAIDGQIAPDFSYDWEVEFKGEKYIMPLRKPQASKSNDSRKSKINLTFQHWAQYQLKRWFFFTFPSENASVAVAEKYNASVSLNLGDFVEYFAKVLNYYYGNSITIDLNPNWDYAKEPIFVSINYSYMWDVLIKLYELYAVRWEITAADGNDPYKDINRYVIRVGYNTEPLDHIFEYGFEGGLLKIERQVQDTNIRNMLMGRGGEKNLPYRYFKDVDRANPSFPADPDWVIELRNFYFDKLRSAEFRSYVQGWKNACWTSDGYNNDKNSRKVERKDTKVPWAWDKGYNDEHASDGFFNPVEFVKDDDSIAKYGELMGSLDDNEEIYPSIQGVKLPELGRIDEAVDVELVKDDVPDITDSMVNASNLSDITFGEVLGTEFPIGGKLAGEATKYVDFDIGVFSIPEGKYGEIENESLEVDIVVYSNGTQDARPKLHLTCNAVAVQGGKEKPLEGLPQGTYSLRIKAKIENTANYGMTIKLILKGARINLYSLDGVDAPKDGRMFDIWIKNIWQTEPKEGEDPIVYAHRVWDDILGNHLGEDAAVVFSTGWLSTSEDYEFRIVRFPVYDTSKALNGVFSHWRLTLERSKADFDTLGKYVPNLERQGNAGDKFFFVGINLTQYYVEWAENRLHDYKLEQLDKVKDINPSWVVGLDKVRIGRKQYDDVTALIDQLHIGGSIRLADKRFILEEGQADIPLYLQTITYKFNEGNTANLTPDVEITLGTEYTTSANPVSTIQGQVDALSRQMGSASVSNIQQIVRQVGDKLYLRKDGLTDRSYSKTYFSDLLAALGFRQGMVGGAGWGFYQDENKKWVLETDRLNVRDEMQVNSFVVNQIQARGGMIIESAASIEISYVENTSDGFKCYFDIKGGSVANLFKLHDIGYCHRFTPENANLKTYRREVLEVGSDYILLSKAAREQIGSYPSEGDVVVQYGNTKDKTRQFVIIRDMIDGGYERMLSGLNSTTATGTEYFFAGYQSSTGERLFIGNKDNYLLYEGGKLTISGILSIQTLIGDKPIDEYIKSFIPDLNLDDWEYLRKALNDGETVGIGGLVLSNLIMLGSGKVSDQTFQVYSGINGQPDSKAKGMGIAAWYGGDMNDGEPSKWYQPNPSNPIRYAQSLFRFDGSGYLAHGNIYWDVNGAGGLAGGNITFSADGSLMLNSGLKIEGGQEGVSNTIASVVSVLNHFTNNFQPVLSNGKVVTWSEINGTTPLYAVKSKVGFYSDSFISAMGMNPSTSGGGGATSLSQLSDVKIGTLHSGDVFQWNGKQWINIPLEDHPVIDDLNIAIDEAITTADNALESASDALSEANNANYNLTSVKHWAALEGNDERNWYDGYSLKTILMNIRDLLVGSAEDWSTTRIDGEDVKTYLQALRAWVGSPSLDTGDWEDGTMYQQLKNIENSKYYQARAPRELKISPTQFEKVNGKIVINPTNQQYIGHTKVFQYGNSLVLTLETLYNVTDNAFVANSSETLKTYACRYNGSAWGNWQLIREDKLPTA